jgi:hypothetical protein
MARGLIDLAEDELFILWADVDVLLRLISKSRFRKQIFVTSICRRITKERHQCLNALGFNCGENFSSPIAFIGNHALDIKSIAKTSCPSQIKHGCMILNGSWAH